MSRLILLYVSAVYVAIVNGSSLAAWNAWDGRWYAGIASHGYTWTYQPGKSALAFFPVYPALVHVAITVGVPEVLGAILISNVAFVVALFYVHAVLKTRFGALSAERALMLLAVFPAAFFTFAPYSESTFLLCAVATFYHANRRQALTTGGWLAAATLTRPTGLILILPAFALLRPIGPRSAVRCLAPVVVAWAGYAAYLASHGSSLRAVYAAQRPWHRSLTWPWTGFTASLDWLFKHGGSNPGWVVENMLGVAVVVLFLALTALAWRSLCAASRLYIGGFWAAVLCTPQWLDGYYAPFSSTVRFVLVLFPLAGWAASRLSGRAFAAVAGGSAVLVSVGASVHLMGGWVG
ncbi:MAG TPA: mannosyltransferase family protein [Chloroflexota bacterium]|nr:mannosyltransferase family protein [Chloroflexota bacterium]